MCLISAPRLSRQDAGPVKYDLTRGVLFRRLVLDLIASSAGPSRDPLPTLPSPSLPLLPPPLPASCVPKRSLGGVVVLSGDGRVKVSNTLEDRLHVTYEANVPVVRRPAHSTCILYRSAPREIPQARILFCNALLVDGSERALPERGVSPTVHPLWFHSFAPRSSASPGASCAFEIDLHAAGGSSVILRAAPPRTKGALPLRCCQRHRAQRGGLQGIDERTNRSFCC